MTTMTPTIPETAVCLGCGYALRDLPEPRCPECGRAFDPADPRTFGPEPRPKWLQPWAAPPPWWHVCAITAFVWALLFHLSVPYGRPAVLGEAPLAGSFVAYTTPWLPLGIGLDYLVRALVAGDDRRSPRRRATKALRCTRWRWVVTPICLCLVSTALAFDWPFEVRFRLSRPAFDRAVQVFRQGQSTNTGPHWIGLYHVKRISNFGPGAVVLKTEYGEGTRDSVGFVYDPRNPPARPYNEYIGQGWYVASW